MASIFKSSKPSNPNAFRVEKVVVTTAGTPVQLPNIALSAGVKVMLTKPDGEAGITYIANSSANTGDATKRFELEMGDSLMLQVKNTNLVWIDGTLNGNSIILTVEA